MNIDELEQKGFLFTNVPTGVYVEEYYQFNTGNGGWDGDYMEYGIYPTMTKAIMGVNRDLIFSRANERLGYFIARTTSRSINNDSLYFLLNTFLTEQRNIIDG